MNTYLFNVQTTVEVQADCEEAALEILSDGIVRDQDILLVQVTA